MDKHEGNGEARHGLQVVQKTEPTSSQEKSQQLDRFGGVEWSAPETVSSIELWLAVLDENSSMAFLHRLCRLFLSALSILCVAAQLSEARQRQWCLPTVIEMEAQARRGGYRHYDCVSSHCEPDHTHTHFYSDGQILGVSAHPRSRSELRNLPRTKPRQARRRFDWLQKGAPLFLSFFHVPLFDRPGSIIPQLAFRILHPWPARDLLSHVLAPLSGPQRPNEN
ncbi:hypothetical protein FALCPG4_001497 [Fusarium falciforme]